MKNNGRFDNWEWGDPPKSSLSTYRRSCVSTAKLVASELSKDASLMPSSNARGDLFITVVSGDSGEMDFKRKIDFLLWSGDWSSDGITSLASALRKQANKLERQAKLKEAKE